MSDAERTSGHDPIPRWEWGIAALGLIVVVATMVILIREGLRRDGRPPEISIHATDVTRTAGAWVVRFEARNAGDEVAAQLAIAGDIVVGDSVVESATAAVDYLPAGARRTGGLHFQQSPLNGTLRLRPVGYQKP